MYKNDFVARLRHLAETAFSTLGIAALLVSLIGLFAPASASAALATLGWVLCGGAAVSLATYMALLAMTELVERR